MLPKFDRFTTGHFKVWLGNNVPKSQRADTKRKILGLLSLDAGLLEGRSWPELLELVERSGVL